VKTSDEELMEACKTGDSFAFEMLYQRYQKPIYNFIRHLIKDASLAEDYTQETFLRVYSNRKKYRRQASFVPWIYRIARNLCYNELKRQERYATVSWHQPVSTESGDILEMLDIIPDKTPLVDERLIASEYHQRVEQAIDILPEIHRQILILRYYQDLSYEEIAKVMNCKIGTVKSRLFYAQKMLKAKLKNP